MKDRIRELEEELNNIDYVLDVDRNSQPIMGKRTGQAAQAILALLKDIEVGKVAVVPTEATDKMDDAMDETDTEEQWSGECFINPNHPSAYKAAIAAAPDMIKEYFSE